MKPVWLDAKRVPSIAVDLWSLVYFMACFDDLWWNGSDMIIAVRVDYGVAP